MTRRKGERSHTFLNLSHPFQVEIQIPGSGLGNAYDIMYRWAAGHDYETTSAYRSMRWCFCRPEVADAFATDFGGRRVDMPVDPRFLAVDRPDARELRRRANAALFQIETVTGGRAPDRMVSFRGADRIPFSSFSNPADVARAQGALDRAWTQVKGGVAQADLEHARMRLAYIVASFALIAGDEEELARRAAEQFRNAPRAS